MVFLYNLSDRRASHRDLRPKIQRGGQFLGPQTHFVDDIQQNIAPPGVHQAADFIAGEFLATVARGNEGFHSSFESHENAGIVDIKGAFTGEFMYSPALEFLARIADAIADANNANVRIEERKIGEELFDAFLKDYNDARPKILALDGESRNPK